MFCFCKRQGFSTIPSRLVRAKECLNEAMAVAAIHEGGGGGLPPECTEEAALNVIAKEATVEEEAVTNESVVEEAWQVVHENFLDARHHSWSADAWLVCCPSPSSDISFWSIKMQTKCFVLQLADVWKRFEEHVVEFLWLVAGEERRGAEETSTK